MDAAFQQFVLLDTVLDNWDGICVRMGVLSALLERELARVAAQLATAQQPGQAAIALDRLLDLTQDTPAYDYVRQLIQRCALPTTATDRGAIGDKAAATYASASVMHASSQLAARAVAPVAFTTRRVFFVTNRKADDTRPWEERYTGDYVPAVSYGRSDVTIPVRTHRIGHLERPLPLVGRERADRHIMLGQGETFDDRDGFASALATDLQKAERPELLVFLHGYRVTFDEAARRAAQIVTDIQFGGAVILFSWPSAGTLMGYLADEDSAAKSAAPLRALLRDLEGGPWTGVHLLAHSMGNRVMVGGLAGREESRALAIRNVMLVAADLDVDLFEQQFPMVRERLGSDSDGLVTSYTSSTDRALGVSSWLHRSTRLGRVGDRPVAFEGVETVDATATDTSLLGLHHGYFAEQRSLLTDIGLLVREGLPAGRRGLVSVAGQWWTFPR